MERTFAIIKPDAVTRNLTGRVLSMVEAAGLEVEALRLVQLTEDQARGFYAVHKAKPFFGSLVSYMTSGPSVLMVLRGDGAIARWRRLMGATNPRSAEENTIRARFGQDVERNSVHGSDAPETAATEIAYFSRALSRWI